MALRSYEKIMQKKPRVLEVVERGFNDTPLGRKKVGRAELRRRADPVVAGVADGSVLLDELSGRLVADALEDAYKESQK